MMKYLKYTSLLLLFWTVLLVPTIFAQSIMVTTEQIEYDDQEVTSLQIKVEPDRSTLQDAFEDWMKDNYDVKIRRTGLFGDKNIRQAKAVNIPSITEDQINLFTRTVEQDDYTMMNLFASRGLSNYLTVDEQAAFRAMENVLDDFLADYLPGYYQQRIEAAKEILTDFQEELEDAKDDFTDNEKDIAKLQEENKALNEEMAALKADIETSQEKLEQRRQRQKAVEAQLKEN